jgi:predicted ATP-grasp superfamily ATP-dependent carboligase
MLQPPERHHDSQPLAIVGASARSAAASAVRAGFRPLAADLFADADLRDIATTTRITPYPEGLLDWLRSVEPAAWMYTGAMENHPELVDQMAWVAPLWGNSGDVLAQVRSPWELARELEGAGLLFPETRSSADRLPHDGSWLVKTYRGASGSGVRVWSGEHGAGSGEQEAGSKEQGFEASSSSRHAACYQRRVAGMPCSAVYVADGTEAALLGITRQLVGEGWLGARGFQYAGSIGPCPVSGEAHATIARIGSVIAGTFELMGLFGIDMVLDGSEVWTIEVNPRYTASVEIVERVTGIHAIAAHAGACALGLSARDLGREQTKKTRDNEPPAPSRQPTAHGKAILFAKRDVVISKEFANSSLAESMKTPWPRMADVSVAGTPVDAGRPVLTLFAEGDTALDVENQLRDYAARLERELEVDS